MNEVEWLSSIEPRGMLRLIQGMSGPFARLRRRTGRHQGRSVLAHPWVWLRPSRPGLFRLRGASILSERKVRLFNAAICRRFWDYLSEASQSILSESELLADGLVKATDSQGLCHRANNVIHELFDQEYPTKQFPSNEVRIQRGAAAAVCYAVLPNELWGAAAYLWELKPSEKEPHSQIIRDVFGNPFRVVMVEPAWLTSNVVSLAQTIYDDRAFDRMPLLGDAIDETGCDSSDILDHCRSPVEHVRGCWVVDALLGKS
jgi:hypothetical protein